MKTKSRKIGRSKFLRSNQWRLGIKAWKTFWVQTRAIGTPSETLINLRRWQLLNKMLEGRASKASSTLLSSRKKRSDNGWTTLREQTIWKPVYISQSRNLSRKMPCCVKKNQTKLVWWSKDFDLSRTCRKETRTLQRCAKRWSTKKWQCRGSNLQCVKCTLWLWDCKTKLRRTRSSRWNSRKRTVFSRSLAKRKTDWRMKRVWVASV